MIDLIRKIESFFQITHSGYAEHFIGGIMIGVVVSYVVFKKTNRIWAALFIGIVITASLGLVKELIDPYMRGSRDKLDLIFTVLGGTIGALVLLLIQKTKEN